VTRSADGPMTWCSPTIRGSASRGNCNQSTMSRRAGRCGPCPCVASSPPMSWGCVNRTQSACCRLGVAVELPACECGHSDSAELRQTTHRTLMFALSIGQQTLRCGLTHREDGEPETVTMAPGLAEGTHWCETPGRRLALPARAPAGDSPVAFRRPGARPRADSFQPLPFPLHLQVVHGH
jgi:hypothetical protein